MSEWAPQPGVPTSRFIMKQLNEIEECVSELEAEASSLDLNLKLKRGFSASRDLLRFNQEARPTDPEERARMYALTLRVLHLLGVEGDTEEEITASVARLYPDAP